MLLKNSEKLKKDLTSAAKEKNLAKRGVRVASVIAGALRSVNQDPVLVGGAAVEFYTEGGYATRDIDMLAPGGPPLWKIMEELDFKRRGRDFINEIEKIYIEFPGEFLEKEKRSEMLDINGVSLRIISREDLVVERLCAYKFWKSAIDGVAALLLLEVGPLDNERLQKRAREEDVLDALNWIRQIYEEGYRKKLSKKVLTQKLKNWVRQ